MDAVTLRPVQFGDQQLLYEWFTDPAVARTWRYRGRTPDPDTFSAQLWSGVLAHFLVFGAGHPEMPIGYVSIYDPNFPARNGKVSAILAPDLRGLTQAEFSFLKVLDFAFSTWPLERLFMECNSYSVAQFERALTDGLFIEEARIRNYECFGHDDWSDLIYLSVSRDTFLAYTSR